MLPSPPRAATSTPPDKAVRVPVLSSPPRAAVAIPPSLNKVEAAAGHLRRRLPVLSSPPPLASSELPQKRRGESTTREASSSDPSRRPTKKSTQGRVEEGAARGASRTISSRLHAAPLDAAATASHDHRRLLPRARYLRESESRALARSSGAGDLRVLEMERSMRKDRILALQEEKLFRENALLKQSLERYSHRVPRAPSVVVAPDALLPRDSSVTAAPALLPRASAYYRRPRPAAVLVHPVVQAFAVRHSRWLRPGRRVAARGASFRGLRGRFISPSALLPR